MDKFNATKLLPVFNVLRMSSDPQIIESLESSTTPAKVLTHYNNYHMIFLLFIHISWMVSYTLIIMFAQPDNEGTSHINKTVTPFVSLITYTYY